MRRRSSGWGAPALDRKGPLENPLDKGKPPPLSSPTMFGSPIFHSSRHEASVIAATMVMWMSMCKCPPLREEGGLTG